MRNSPSAAGRRFRIRQADRAVGFPLVQGADMASLGAADAVLDRQAADRADLFAFLH